MAQIRHVVIQRFRGISEASWAPRLGVNALIGPGDAGKSTLLDAIDVTLATRRAATFTDADFHNLEVSEPIDISVTLGELPDRLLDLENYAMFLRGWNAATAAMEPEPGEGLEPVLTVRLTVAGDLDPKWGLFSERAEAEGVTRDLPYAERVALAPTRLGAFANHHFAWGARSVLNKLTDERANASEALATAAREARATFGASVAEQVAEAIRIVRTVSRDVGVVGAQDATALLDAHGVSFSGGAIALHDGAGVPLRNLGVGSARLLVASLQAQASNASNIALIDELEHGLEPFRIIRLLHTLGSKSAAHSRQIFLTTHSPTAVRELMAGQVARVRRAPDGRVDIACIGDGEAHQATLRACAEAFLAPNVLVCEGPTEIGLMRGLDLYWAEQGLEPLALRGVAVADGGGSNMFVRAACFGRLGYRTCLFRDADVALTAGQTQLLTETGVIQFAWAAGQSTEQALFEALPDAVIATLLDIAAAHVGNDAVAAQIRNQGEEVLGSVEFGIYTPDVRAALGRAAGKGKWFKMVEPAERVGREVVGPNLNASAASLLAIFSDLRSWIDNATRAPAPAADDIVV